MPPDVSLAADVLLLIGAAWIVAAVLFVAFLVWMIRG